MAKQKIKLTEEQLKDAVVYAVCNLYMSEEEIQEMREWDDEEGVLNALETNNVITALVQLFEEVYKKEKEK